MTQQDKELLLKDLCARLPYGTKVNYNGLQDYTLNIKTMSCFPVEKLKPYLRPISSMTDDEWKTFYANRVPYDGRSLETEVADADFLYSRHLDCHHLIDKGLAVAVTEENNPYV